MQFVDKYTRCWISIFIHVAGECSLAHLTPLMEVLKGGPCLRVGWRTRFVTSDVCCGTRRPNSSDVNKLARVQVRDRLRCLVPGIHAMTLQAFVVDIVQTVNLAESGVPSISIPSLLRMRKPGITAVSTHGNGGRRLKYVLAYRRHPLFTSATHAAGRPIIVCIVGTPFLVGTDGLVVPGVT
jgi:hypothetical protein